jgi:hypothetical protein
LFDERRSNVEMAIMQMELELFRGTFEYEQLLADMDDVGSTSNDRVCWSAIRDIFYF